MSAVAVHPGAAATNLFARQLERSGRGLLAHASKSVTSVLLSLAACESYDNGVLYLNYRPQA